MADLIRSRFRLFLEVEGVRFEVVRFGADFRLNQIPEASCLLAIGRRAADGKTPATAHRHFEKLRRKSKAEVFFCPSGQWAANENWPEGVFRIFDGRILSVGTQKVNGQAHLLVTLKHWLDDLDFSSTLSHQSHVQNPTQLTFTAVASSLTNVQGGQPRGIAQTAEVGAITNELVREDLWGKVIKKIFCGLAGSKSLKFVGALKDCLDLERRDNTQALAALERIEGVTGGDCSKELSCYTPKLSLDTAVAVPHSVSKAIASTLGREAIETFVHSSIWGTLVGRYAPEFLFGVVPLIEKALVVPVMPGLQDTYCKPIAACDYDVIKDTTVAQRAVRGVVIYAGKSWTTNGDPNMGRTANALLGVGGCFVPQNADPDGMLLVRMAPTWLQETSSRGHNPTKSTGLRKKLARSSATTPRAGRDAGLLANQDGKTQTELIQGSAAMFDGYAHAVYVREALRGRSVFISGKLRFDIAPGSNVFIEGKGEKFIENDQLANNMVGTVIGTAIGLDAESGKGGTSFQLGFLRTEEENKDDKTSVARHPLYTTTFLGAPLLDEFLFPNDECCDEEE